MLFKFGAGFALTLAIFVQPMLAQTISPPTLNPFIARYQANATTTALTVQGTGKSGEAYFETADVYCVASQSVSISINGTAATSTTLAPVAIGVAAVTTPLTSWTASNAGTGTTLKTYVTVAGQTMILDRDMVAFYFPSNAPAATNLTISSTGSCTIHIQWRAL
jgi:hypothetical protein